MELIKRRQYRFLISKFILLTCMVCVQVPAQADTIHIGLSDWPPFSKHEKLISGLDVDLWNEIATRMKMDLKITACAWARCLLDLKYGAIDAMNSMAKSNEREQYAKYLNSHMNNVTVFYTNKGKAHTIQHYDDLYQYTIGYVRGSQYFEPFDSDKNIKKYAAVHEHQAMAMILKGRFPVLVGSNPNIEYQLKEMGYSGHLVKTVYDPEVKVPLYFSISKKSKFIKKFDQLSVTINEMIAEGEIEKILDRYR